MLCLVSRCSCPIENKCEDVECPVGYHLDVISEATGLPGSCCTKFTCIPEFFLTCKFNGKEMRNGEVWKADECRTCTCNNGVSKCTRRTCPGPSCSYMVYIEGECCPVCRGCVSESGQVHNESDTWKENDCTTCTCRNGKAECQAEMCAVECLKPKRVPGQCCSVCEETCNLFCPFGFKLDSQGNSLCVCSEDKCAAFKEQKCDKHCEYGYKTTRDGCVKCKCNKCPQLECTKRCTHGYALNDEGCPLCKCKESYTPGLISTEHQRGDGRQCMSQQGSRYVNGESWNDGCRKCYCHNGLEMCSLLACPAPICNHPVFRVGDCCPTCPGLTVPELEGEGEKCQSAEGHHYVEGETWQMDSCTLCVCHGGNILCQTSSCPPVVCHHPVKPEGQCCAICRGDDLSSLPVAGHHHCRSPTSMMYKHGETWQSTPCQSCTCLDGQIICYNQVCPAVSCNKTVLKKGQCCPTCVEAAKAQFCVYNNVTYDSGEKWQGDNCTQCVCVHGKKECFPMSCPSLDCTFGVIKMSGQCCLECYDGPKPEATVHNSTYEQQVYTHSDTSEHGEEKSTFNATAFGFSMLALALGLIIVIGVLVRILILKSRQYRSRPNGQNVENQRNLLQNENKMYWPVKFTPVKAPDIVNKNRSSNDYTEMDFSDGSKGSYRPAVNS
uniref:VWFC domain-containing protein n=1 Tax=Biomphalaria glabrata TaxID=6526 RepID=A0A2C9K5C6_BIOGL